MLPTRIGLDHFTGLVRRFLVLVGASAREAIQEVAVGERTAPGRVRVAPAQ